MNNHNTTKNPFPYLVDRRGSDSLKWRRCEGTDRLPMWVADMDFRCADAILEALHKRIDHGVFGYAVPAETTVQAVVNWLQSRYGWTIRPEWIVWLPGLVPALQTCCRAFATQSQQVLTFTPIYPPFLSAPVQSHRELVKCPLAVRDGRYTFDMDLLSETVTEDTRLILLCSPHNPVGRAWNRDELMQLAAFCLERNIVLCSDEIHCDLILDQDIKHVPTAMLSSDIAANTVTLMSPAKTFNLPGLNCGFAVISDARLRTTFKKAAYAAIPHVNALGYVACEAAFTKGRPWLGEILAYLRTNRDLLYHAINNEIDGLTMFPVEATYLAWFNTRQLRLPDVGAFFEQAGIDVIDGVAFGQPGFARINFACSREHLLLAIDRIKQAVKQLDAKQ